MVVCFTDTSDIARIFEAQENNINNSKTQVTRKLRSFDALYLLGVSFNS